MTSAESIQIEKCVAHVIENIVASMKSVPQRIQAPQVRHFYNADPAYGTGVAKGLGLNTEKIIATESKVAAAD